ncbi:PAS domain-containing hybrid sensor histidine kinase/response regulator [Altibacter sp.]|uniref:PAS domain-containing hybrid sensor histidine kinase/response regulator n=1 Tax=Altibacter sp. TaxID=2024823 RepID=UPI000C95A24D|nr:PAS domain-containing hybrid sensor histidine kinase/response regulator [Altibacter sp.]MAP55580.1 hybrid sensor histidine kinase/response regulator [Altibacter sp.]
MEEDEPQNATFSEAHIIALELYDNAPCGSITFFKDGTIYAINQTMLTWLGYKREELLQKQTLTSLFRIGGQIFFETHFFPLIKMQGFINEVYFDVVRKDKSIFHALINARELPSKEGEPAKYQATVLDISDRWRYEQELLHAKRAAEADIKAKAEFLATISHEIRTPLNTILGIGHLLHETPLNENQKEYARLLLHSSENLLSLVNNLLDLSKIEAKKVQLEQIPFNLEERLAILHETFSVKARAKGIQLEVTIAKGVPKYLLGDPVKLNQILTNLIGNAIKFTKTGKITLEVTTVKRRGEERQLHFSVTDTGMGIPPEKLEAIFQEFSQASYDVSVEFGGTGLGLTISQKLLELHGSTMEVKSTLGEGSCFHFSIWYTESKKTSLPQKKDITKIDKRALKGIHVLVVDDNPDNIFIASQYLSQWNVPFKKAHSGTKALELLSEDSFDLVLLDLQMPKMDGYQVATTLRSDPSKKQPVIIAFSASSVGEVSDRLAEAGIDDYLPKPFEPNELLEKLLQYSVQRTPHSKKKKSKAVLSKRPTQPKKKSDAPRIADHPSDTPSFTIDKYVKMANNRPEYIKKFVLSTLDAFETYHQDFEKSVAAKDAEGLSGLIHKSTMSFFYIEANRLGTLLNACKESLSNLPESEADFNGLVAQCREEFTIIQHGLTEIGTKQQ